MTRFPVLLVIIALVVVCIVIPSDGMLYKINCTPSRSGMQEKNQSSFS